MAARPKVKKSAGSDTAQRQRGGIVPAPPGSSSDEGLPKDLRAGSLGALATALVKCGEGLVDAVERARAIPDEEAYSREAIASARTIIRTVGELQEVAPLETMGDDRDRERCFEVFGHLLNSSKVISAYVEVMEAALGDLVCSGMKVVRRLRPFIEVATNTVADDEEEGAVTQLGKGGVSSLAENRGEASSEAKEDLVGGASGPSEAMEVAEEEPVSGPPSEEEGSGGKGGPSWGESPVVLPESVWGKIGEMVKEEVRRALAVLPARRSPDLGGRREEAPSGSPVVGSGEGGPSWPRKRRKRGRGDIAAAAVAASVPPPPSLVREGGDTPQVGAAPQVVKKGAVARAWARVGGAWTPRCYRCLLLGHVGAGCTSSVYRGHLCYRCGSPGHNMMGCRTRPSCPVCRDLGAPAVDHALGEGSLCSVVGGVEHAGGGVGGTSAPVAARQGPPGVTRGSKRAKTGVG